MTMNHKEALWYAFGCYAHTESPDIQRGVEVAILAYIEARGLALVPREPTKEMWQAGTTAIEDKRDWSRDTNGEYECTSPSDQAIPCFEAMLAAAPDPFAEDVTA